MDSFLWAERKMEGLHTKIAVPYVLFVFGSPKEN